MKFDYFKIRDGKRSVQVRVAGYTFGVAFDLWTGLYGFPESRGGSFSLHFYKDFPKRGRAA